MSDSILFPNIKFPRLDDFLKNLKKCPLRPLLIGFLIIFCVALQGCSSANVVNVPVKCSVEMPKEPTRGANDYETLRDLLAYLKKLKPILKECINDTSEW